MFSLQAHEVFDHLMGELKDAVVDTFNSVVIDENGIDPDSELFDMTIKITKTPIVINRKTIFLAARYHVCLVHSFVDLAVIGYFITLVVLFSWVLHHSRRTRVNLIGAT
jgi:hypothetical protein